MDDLSMETSSCNQGSQQCPCGTQTSKSRWNIRGQWAPRSWQNVESLSLSIIPTDKERCQGLSARHKRDIVVLVCHSHPAAIMELPFWKAVKCCKLIALKAYKSITLWHEPRFWAGVWNTTSEGRIEQHAAIFQSHLQLGATNPRMLIVCSFE